MAQEVSRHHELLKEMAAFRSALINKFQWFIHSAPDSALGRIRTQGLVVNHFHCAPKEVRDFCKCEKIPILCLHPMGAKLEPRGTMSNLPDIPLGDQDPKKIKFAIGSTDLPARVGLDWTYEWDVQDRALRKLSKVSVECVGVWLAHELGSIVSYDGIASTSLRVCVKSSDQKNPSSWPSLCEASDADILSFQ